MKKFKLNTLFDKIESFGIRNLSFPIGNYRINTFVVDSTSGDNDEQISFFIANFHKSVNIDRSTLLRNFDPSEELKPFKKVIKDNYNKEKEVSYLKVPYELFKKFITNLYNFYDNNKK